MKVTEFDDVKERDICAVQYKYGRSIRVEIGHFLNYNHHTNILYLTKPQTLIGIPYKSLLQFHKYTLQELRNL